MLRARLMPPNLRAGGAQIYLKREELAFTGEYDLMQLDSNPRRHVMCFAVAFRTVVTGNL